MVDLTVETRTSVLRPGVEAALAGCFEAVITPELWPQATEALAFSMGALGACFHAFGAGERRLQAPMSNRYREMLDEFLADGWAGQDLRSQRGWPLAKQGRRTFLENDLSTPEERARAPIYNELFRRHDLDTFAALTFRADDRLWSFNIVRSRTMGDYDIEAARELAALGPHLSRLVRFGEVMAYAGAQGAMGTLERSATGAILLNWRGQVVEMNSAARRMIGSGLSVRSGRLCADRPAAQAALERLVSRVVHSDTGRLGSDDGPVAVANSSGGMLLIDAIPTQHHFANAFGPAAAILIVTDTGRRPEVSQALLRRLYGLTRREAEVAGMMAAGDGVGDITNALGLMASSVRQMIKAVLSKTGTQRQAELVALLSRLPSAVEVRE